MALHLLGTARDITAGEPLTGVSLLSPSQGKQKIATTREKQVKPSVGMLGHVHRDAASCAHANNTTEESTRFVRLFSIFNVSLLRLTCCEASGSHMRLKSK